MCQHEVISGWQWLRPAWMLPPRLLNEARHHTVNRYGEEAGAGAITWRKAENT